MHFRRLACVLLGVWLGASVLGALVIWHNRGSADHLIKQPTPVALVFLNTAGRQQTADFLRYYDAEASQSFAETAQTIEVAVLGAVLLVVLFGTHEGKFPLLAAVLMLGATVAQRVFLTPEIDSNGRLLDFVAAGGGAGVRARLHVLKGAWLVFEGGKLAAAMVLMGFLLLRRTGPSTRSEATLAGAAYRRSSR